MLKFKIKAFSMPLKRPFRISRYTVETQQTAIVSISDGDCTGYGEATANPYYSSSIEKIEESVVSVRSMVEKVNGTHPNDLWHQIEPGLRTDYFSLSAIDCAYWDYYARANNRTLRSYWSNSETDSILSNYTIGIDSIEIMKEKILEKPWPIYKIKLGTPDDISIIRELRTVTDALFRVDANCAWTVDETIRNAKELKALYVEFIEQPLPADDWEGMRYLKSRSVLPTIADESCQRYEDVRRCAEAFHGINIKLMKCGGITPALQMIKTARELGLKVMAGCMTESTVGISNLTQLAPLLDYIDADGPLLLKEDIATGVSFQKGRIIYSSNPGSGAVLK
ncbi:MAG: dipeptide epimerase [Flavobacteriaceae bacterium]|nr:dipeptide epimerase [Flavobacteriaceae bacterium]NNK71915.1 dipeptide epimerase [Flavobacteriaceae bacterium]